MSAVPADDSRLATMYEERVREQDGSHPGYYGAWGHFASAVLSNGGRLVVPPRRPDPLVDMLSVKGFLWQSKIELRPRDRSNCHRNAVSLWRSGEAVAIGTGYGLSDDGLWREHSWGVGPEGEILETTRRRTKYFGVEFREDGARWFADWIAPEPDNDDLSDSE